MTSYELTLRDVVGHFDKLGERVDKLGDHVDKLGERVDKLSEHVDDRINGVSSQLADLRNDVAGLRGEWGLAKWVLAVFGAPAWAAVIYVIVRDLSSSA